MQVTGSDELESKSDLISTNACPVYCGRQLDNVDFVEIWRIGRTIREGYRIIPCLEIDR